MTIRVNYSPDAAVARLQRKADQHDEMGCLALQDGDKADATRQFARAKQYRQEARDLS